MKELNHKKVLRYAFTIILGLIAGYAYWYYIGCTSGSCPLKSSWYFSSFFGGIIGYLLADTFLSSGRRKKGSKSN